tara:strand:+ start:865 stop:1158 length:294 start_codon:yes stop_codon:yes gene_type:complete
MKKLYLNGLKFYKVDKKFSDYSLRVNVALLQKALKEIPKEMIDEWGHVGFFDIKERKDGDHYYAQFDDYNYEPPTKTAQVTAEEHSPDRETESNSFD